MSKTSDSICTQVSSFDLALCYIAIIHNFVCLHESQSGFALYEMYARLPRVDFPDFLQANLLICHLMFSLHLVCIDGNLA